MNRKKCNLKENTKGKEINKFLKIQRTTIFFENYSSRVLNSRNSNMGRHS
jgi:hypothetical protein